MLTFRSLTAPNGVELETCRPHRFVAVRYNSATDGTPFAVVMGTASSPERLHRFIHQWERSPRSSVAIVDMETGEVL